MKSAVTFVENARGRICYERRSTISSVLLSVFVFPAVVFLLSTATASADLISTFPVAAGAFGGAPGSGGNGDLRYLAQTFVALPGHAKTAKFALSYNTGGGAVSPSVDFNLLLTETSGDAAGYGGFVSTFHPTTILFQSGVISLPDGSNDLVTTVDLGGISLVPGDYYALVLDPISMFNSPAGEADGHTGSVNIPGTFFFQESSSSSDAAHLAGQWYNLGSGADMSFSIQFVPEPHTFSLAATGLAGLFVGLRRRKSPT